MPETNPKQDDRGRIIQRLAVLAATTADFARTDIVCPSNLGLVPAQAFTFSSRFTGCLQATHGGQARR